MSTEVNPVEINSTSHSQGLHRFAVVCAAATFILIFIGGLVTSTGSALAVPDWPLAFGHLIPKLQGGVRFEYGHRVAAGTVVILTLILAIWTWRAEPRSWVRKTAFAALGLVVVQAVLGGITVLLLLPLPIAVAHAATAQAFFCVMVAIAIFTNPEFGAGPNVRSDYRHPRLATLAAVTTGIIYIQILIGAVMRHLGAGLAIPDFPLSYGHLIPPFLGLGVDVNFAHRCGALVVTFFVLWVVIRVLRFHRGERRLWHSAVLLLLLLITQISLGALTIWSGRAVLPTTAHVAVGAAVLATSLTLTIRARAIGGLASASEAARVR
ncbi:MAG TPA: COX15/CtaA family protein, partial [Candidatus Binataceae bacterium]|nr:COX15/CtaA family protein [Candidatus Binataceae bacterium]